MRGLGLAYADAALMVTAFRDWRLRRIIAGNLPVPMVGGAGVVQLVIHVVDVATFRADERYDVGREIPSPPHWSGSGGEIRPNVDGAIHHDYRGDGEVSRYTQAFPFGAVEGVATLARSGELEIYGSWIDQTILRMVPDYFRYLDTRNLVSGEHPRAVSVTMLGARGRQLVVSPLHSRDQGFDRDVVCVAPVIVDAAQPTAAQLRPLLDNVWRAAGSWRDPYYDDAGEWQQPQRW